MKNIPIKLQNKVVGYIDLDNTTAEKLVKGLIGFSAESLIENGEINTLNIIPIPSKEENERRT